MHKLQLKYINGLVQEQHDSTANELELCLSCTNPSIYMLSKFLFVSDVVNILVQGEMS